MVQRQFGMSRAATHMTGPMGMRGAREFSHQELVAKRAFDVDFNAAGCLSVVLEAMNRNGRMAKKANHGARPCSSRARKWKRKQRKLGHMRKRG